MMNYSKPYENIRRRRRRRKKEKELIVTGSVQLELSPRLQFNIS
jgi:hypothetical protein